MRATTSLNARVPRGQYHNFVHSTILVDFNERMRDTDNREVNNNIDLIRSHPGRHTWTHTAHSCAAVVFFFFFSSSFTYLSNILLRPNILFASRSPHRSYTGVCCGLWLKSNLKFLVVGVLRNAAHHHLISILIIGRSCTMPRLGAQKSR